MQIRMSTGFEERLEASLRELEAKIESHPDCDEPVIPHEEWERAGMATAGILHEFARNRVVHVTAKDFEQGTLRVLVPCKIVFCESIQFNPNTGVKDGASTIDRRRDVEHDWLPYPGQAAYDPQNAVEGIHGATPSRAFHLGFFAAMTIEHTSGTIVDLNGFRFSCHPDFAMQQRFHAIIELANQPFVPGQGPADFGAELRPAKKVWIRNGELGRSSHHGIHGNGMQDVLVSDVTFRDYEVAGISLNGGRRIVIRDCQLEGTFTQVPILGTYSAGRFARLIGSQLIARTSRLLSETKPPAKHVKEIESRVDDLEQAIKRLHKALDDAFDCAKAGELDDVDELFRNPAYRDPQTGEILHLADANPYGIAIHSRGVLVNAFLCNGSKIGALDDLARAYECTDVTLERVNIAKTRGNVREVLAFAAKDAKKDVFNVISDAAGAVFRFLPFDTQLPNVSDAQPGNMTFKPHVPSKGRPKLTLLGKVQIAIAALEKALVDAGLMEAERMLTKNLQPILGWALGDGSWIEQEESKFDWTLKSKSNDPGLDLRLRSNGDLMHHVNKGALGLFVQAVDGLRVHRVVVAGVENVGLPGSNLAGPYRGPDDGGHGSQDQQIGYSGADARGIYLGACSNVCTDRAQAHGVISHYGHATGVEIAGGTEHAEVHSAVAGNVSAGVAFRGDGEPRDFTDRHPNAAPVAVGLIVDGTTRNVGVEDFQVTGEVSQPGRKPASNLRVEGQSNRLDPDHRGFE